MRRWLRRAAIALMAVVVILAAYVAAVWFFGPKEKRYRLGMMYTAMTANHRPPPIAASGVISGGADWMMPEPASTKFTAILRKRFPPGSSTEAMRRTLVSQGFEADIVPVCGEGNGTAAAVSKPLRCHDREASNRLAYHWGGAPCDQALRVSWTADRAGRLVAIQGGYGAACL